MDSIKYLGVTITHDLRWNTHINNMCTKANRTSFLRLRRNLYQCPQDVKETAYRGLVRPILENGSCIWNFQGVVLQQEIEKIQNRDIRKGSFFPQTNRGWNALPNSIITSVKGAEDGEARFTSLVRARD